MSELARRDRREEREPARRFARRREHSQRRHRGLAVLLALRALLAFDNWRTGMGWDATGPQAGYFPFYLSLILAARLHLRHRQGAAPRGATPSEPFVGATQLRRVMQVFVPTLALRACSRSGSGFTSRASSSSRAS